MPPGIASTIFISGSSSDTGAVVIQGSDLEPALYVAAPPGKAVAVTVRNVDLVGSNLSTRSIVECEQKAELTILGSRVRDNAFNGITSNDCKLTLDALRILGLHERQVPLSPQLREALIAARVHERPRDEAAALSTRGAAWGPDGAWKALQSTLRRLNLPGERLHALRAFFVTILLSGNVPVHVVRELVGHGDLATTQGYAAIRAHDRGAGALVTAGGRRSGSWHEPGARDSMTGAPERTLGERVRRRALALR
mgnify:CR=1 FL=1